MATIPQHLIGENEYLQTSYRPDCDYVGGCVREHNLGMLRKPDDTQLRSIVIRIDKR
jgi:hypothetical protein